MPGHQGSKVFGQWEMAKQHHWGLSPGSAEANPSPHALPANALGCLVERWVSPGSLNPRYLCVCYPINNSFIFSGVYQVSFLLSPDLKMYDVSRKKGSDASLWCVMGQIVSSKLLLFYQNLRNVCPWQPVSVIGRPLQSDPTRDVGKWDEGIGHQAYLLGQQVSEFYSHSACSCFPHNVPSTGKSNLSQKQGLMFLLCLALSQHSVFPPKDFPPKRFFCRVEPLLWLSKSTRQLPSQPF